MCVIVSQFRFKYFKPPRVHTKLANPFICISFPHIRISWLMTLWWPGLYPSAARLNRVVWYKPPIEGKKNTSKKTSPIQSAGLVGRDNNPKCAGRWWPTATQSKRVENGLTHNGVDTSSHPKKKTTNTQTKTTKQISLPRLLSHRSRHPHPIINHPTAWREDERNKWV